MVLRFKSAVFVVVTLFVCLGMRSQVTTIKLATLAPSGTTWMNIMQEMVKELHDKSDGKIRIKIYPGGVIGDERDMVRRMKIGQLHCAAMTTIGISIIQKEALVFQLPLMFQSYEELDYARDNLLSTMEEAFEHKGFILLGWGDVGPVHIFSKNPIQNKEDLRKSKLWGWVDDPIATALCKEGGITPIPLSVSEVLPSLQTGIVNAAPSTPLACIALQWFSKFKFMSDLAMSIAIGATVMTKKQFDQMDASTQALLRDVAKRYHRKLTQRIRKDNEESIETLKKNGIRIVPATEGGIQEWEEVALSVRKKLVGQIYSQELLDEVTRLVQEYRVNNAK
jgi:TRAP-type C4-dicarboxylate transport system substrate-binding protein